MIVATSARRAALCGVVIIKSPLVRRTTALAAPAGTPAAMVERLHAELKAIMAMPDPQRQFIDLGNIPLVSPPPEELQRYVKFEIGRWGTIVQQAGLAGSE
jgi:tripartite-type tricarboxylate transporter receptor subunit TctC